MKDWIKGPFLEVSRYKDSTPAVITVHKAMFDVIFEEQDRYSAFLDYMDIYHSEALSISDVQDLLQNFQRCASCETWYDRDDLVDTEQMIGGGIGMVCPDCKEWI